MAHPSSHQSFDGSAGLGPLAAGLAAVWLIVVPLLAWFIPPAAGFDGPAVALLAFMALLPAVLVWLAGRIIRSNQADIAVTIAAIEAVRQSVLANQANQASPEPSVEKKLDELVQAAKNTEDAVVSFASSRQVSRLIVPKPAPHPSTEQRDLPLGTPAEELDPVLDLVDLIRGLNFPDNESDTEGFAALRRTLRDRNARKLVQASQDVLTLLSQDGIYMDDLRPGQADVSLWRRFAKGERGDQMDGVGGIRDRSSLALTSGRMREDTIFRDTVHHFLRKFDQMLVKFEDQATDSELGALANTRTARAFVLLARATGTFD